MSAEQNEAPAASLEARAPARPLAVDPAPAVTPSPTRREAPVAQTKSAGNPAEFAKASPTEAKLAPVAPATVDVSAEDDEVDDAADVD